MNPYAQALTDQLRAAGYAADAPGPPSEGASKSTSLSGTSRSASPTGTPPCRTGQRMTAWSHC